MAVKNKSLKLSAPQIVFIRGLAGVKGIYISRSPANTTARALLRRELVSFIWEHDCWKLTSAGVQYFHEHESKGADSSAKELLAVSQ